MRLSRRDRILVLAWSLLDLMPAPATATGKLRAGQRRGESAHHREPCPSCPPSSPGVVHDRFGRPSPCPTCGGHGSRWVDGLTLQPTQPPDWSPALADIPMLVRTRRVRCDRCGGDGVWRHARCEPCDGTGQVEMPRWVEDDTATVLDRVDDPVLGPLGARDRQGSWHDLDLALERLRKHDRLLARRFVAAHVVAGRDQQRQLEPAYVLLEQWMPWRIMVSGQVVSAWLNRHEYARRSATARASRMGRAYRDGELELRDMRIRRMALEGIPPARIAADTGVSERTVRRVVNERRAVAA